MDTEPVMHAGRVRRLELENEQLQQAQQEAIMAQTKRITDHFWLMQKLERRVYGLELAMKRVLGALPSAARQASKDWSQWADAHDDDREPSSVSAGYPECFV